MIQPPFLSYKRTDKVIADALDNALVHLGIGRWRDIMSLGLGEPTTKAIGIAIREKTGGFIWLGTPASLDSNVIRNLEVPTALRRSKRASGYPFVPLFSGLRPEDARLKAAFGRWPWNRDRCRRIRDANGLVRERGQDVESFAWAAACRYQAAAIQRLVTERGEVSIQLLSGQAPSPVADLVFDWRDLLHDGWPMDDGEVSRILLAIRCMRRALQDASGSSRLTVCTDLRLPMAALMGWELNPARMDDVCAIQTFGYEAMLIDDETEEQLDLPELTRDELGGSGPNVLSVSVCTDLARTAERYAEQCGARSLTRIHVPERLTASGIAALACKTRELLVELNAEGHAKHLLLLGPSTLAFWIGRNARGAGETIVPFWDQADDYDGHVVIGGNEHVVHRVATGKTVRSKQGRQEHAN